MSCSPIVACSGVSIPPTTDANAVALQQQVCALQALMAERASKTDLEHLAGQLRSHAEYSGASYASRCTQESTLATLAVHRDNLGKVLNYAGANHSALAARTEKLAQDSNRSDRLTAAYIASLEAYLQAWQSFEFFRMTEVTAKISDAACRFESDFITAQQAIAAVTVSVPATITNALSSILNATVNYVRGADLKSLRNREFITGFAWGGFGTAGLVDYGFNAQGMALVGAFGLV